MAASAPTIFPRDTAAVVRAALAGGIAAGAGAVVLHAFPQLRLEVFARSAAQLVASLGGLDLVRGEAGWAMPLAGQRVVISAACSGGDFYLMAAALLGWRVFAARQRWAGAVAAGLALALPFAVSVNALRITAVAHAHRWFIPSLPESGRAFAHLLVGAAIFLPALIALNLVLETYAARRRPSSA